MKKLMLLLLLLLFPFFVFSQVELKVQEDQRKQRVESSIYVKEFSKDGRDYLLYDVLDYPLYLETHNIDAAVSTRTNYVNNQGLNGENQTLYIWDSGAVLPTHQEFGNRVISGDGGTTLSDHATHVAGTMMASGIDPLAKGMAPLATIKSYDWNNDLIEATQAANLGMLISNHSYGLATWLLPDYYFGGYVALSRNWDVLLYGNPYYLQVTSAGNSGHIDPNSSPLDQNHPEYDKLVGSATSKNNLVIASSQDAQIDSEGNLINVNISFFSSQGPTNDLRIKPDITGNGQGLYSSTISSNTSYGTKSGTSMSSPNVAGSLILIQEHYKNLYNTYLRASTLKGLALHTADDAGMVGPDAIFGWGLLNLKSMKEVIDNNESIIREITLTNGTSYTIDVNVPNPSELKASISWTDLPGVAHTILNNPNPILINDIDIRIEKDGVIYYPWTLTGVNINTQADNNKDPFERIDIDNAQGTYTITVTHKGTLNEPQVVSLIVTGGIEVQPICSTTPPSYINSSIITEYSLGLNWEYIEGATYELNYKANDSINWNNVMVFNNSYILDNLDSATLYNIKVKSICPNQTSQFSSIYNFTTLLSCDYNFTLEPTVTNVTALTARIQWSHVEIPFYQVRYKKVSDVDYNYTSTINNFLNLNSLDPETDYVGNIRIICGESGYSQWSSDFNFTTEEPCVILPPTNIVVSNIQSDQVTVNWDLVPDAVSYQLKWHRIGTNVNTFSSSTSPPRIITNLVPDSEYRLEISTRCVAGNNSGFSDPIYFTTGDQSPCDTTSPSNGLVANITQISAHISWNGNYDEYTLEYQNLSTGQINNILVSTESYTLNNLEPSTNYNVSIIGRCNGENVTLPLNLQFTTLSLILTPPYNLITNNIGINHVDLSWNSNITYDSYNVSIQRHQGNNPWINYTTNNLNITINQLLENTRYNVYVKGIINNQHSNNSEILTFRTFKSSGGGGGNNNPGQGNNKNQFLGEKHIKVYPNPTINNRINIQTHFEVIQIKVYDIYLREISMECTKIIKGYEVILNNPKTGIYILDIDGEKHIVMLK